MFGIIEHCIAKIKEKCLAPIAGIVNPCSFPSKVEAVCSYSENVLLA